MANKIATAILTLYTVAMLTLAGVCIALMVG